jgi:hypothetical protein
MSPGPTGLVTDAELRRIRKWPDSDPVGLLDFIKSIWNYGDWGFKMSGKKVLRVELHTGGWSGNEEIIQHFEKKLLWYMSWMKSTRGGHYYLRVEPRLYRLCKGAS